MIAAQPLRLARSWRHIRPAAAAGSQGVLSTVPQERSALVAAFVWPRSAEGHTSEMVPLVLDIFFNNRLRTYDLVSQRLIIA